MDSIFKIISKRNTIEIHGLEQEHDEYMYEDVYDTSPSYQQYKYSESVTLNIVQKIHSDNTSEIVFSEVLTHDVGADLSIFDLPEDGLYQVTHIILPTIQFLSSANGWIEDIRNMYYSADGPYYFYLYDNGNFVAYDLSNMSYSREVSIEEILETNTNFKTTIVKNDSLTFCIQYLKDCIYKSMKDSLKSEWNKCKSKNVKYISDLTYTALYVIQYMIELEQYLEAQRLLEKFLHCGGICTNKHLKSGECNCGT